jgi:hypothetical protein
MAEASGFWAASFEIDEDWYVSKFKQGTKESKVEKTYYPIETCNCSKCMYNNI